MTWKETFALMLMLLFSTLPAYGQSIFRPIDPNNPGDRYGKSPYDDPPFLHFGSTSQKYHVAHTQYNGHEDAAAAAFSSWNSAGPVQFSSSSSSGLALTAQARDPDVWGPAWAFTSFNGSTYKINPSNSYITLNTNYTWSETQQDIENDVLDVQSMVVHEAGHIHGLAHPLEGSYTHDASAPTMAGGDNEYFHTSLAGRSLETQDELGTQWLQLRVPDLYSNLQTALSIAGQVGVGHIAITGPYTITGNATFPSGVTLQTEPGASVTIASSATATIPSGTVLSFEGGARLNVNGTLNATGATFDFGSPGSSNGIRFNSGSSGSIDDCTIRNASYGIYTTGVLPSIENSTITDNNFGIEVNNVNTTATRIYDNNISGNSGIGIRASYSTVRIEDNFIDANNTGIFGVQSSPYISGNHIVNNGDGVFMVNNSPARLYKYGGGAGYNFIYGSGDALYADYHCNVQGNGNDLFAPGSSYGVRANGSVVVQMQTNYWGQHPPDPSDFYATNGATILYNPGSTTPFTQWASKNAPVAAVSHAGKPAPGVVILDKELLEASRLQMEGRYEEAIELYEQGFEQPINLETKQYILSQLAESYRGAERKDFIDFLDRTARPALSEDNPLYATTLELENRFLLNEGHYEQALANFNVLESRFSEDERIHKHALFGLGYVHYVLLNDALGGAAYFAELNAKYPEDALTLYAALFLKGVENDVAPEVARDAELSASDPADAYLGNYPNPFNPVTTIQFTLPEQTHVRLAVYDLVGREVIRAVDGRLEAGMHEVRVAASELSSGVYVYRLDTGTYSQTRRMVVVK